MFLKYIKIILNFFGSYFLSSIYPTKFTNKIKRKILLLQGVIIGNNPMIHLGVFLRGHTKIKIGINAVISKDVMLLGSGGLIIGDNTLIGYGTKILTANHILPENKEELIRFSGHKLEAVKIGHNVWIGANCVILPGVIIGNNTVVAAGAVVTKSFGEGLIIGGVPAKVIKNR